MADLSCRFMYSWWLKPDGGRVKLALCGLQKPLRECSTKCAAFLSLWVVTRYFSDCRETLVVLCMHVGNPSKCMIYCNIQKCKFTKSGSTTLSCLCFFSKPWKPKPLAQRFVDGWPLTLRGWQTRVCRGGFGMGSFCNVKQHHWKMLSFWRWQPSRYWKIPER